MGGLLAWRGEPYGCAFGKGDNGFCAVGDVGLCACFGVGRPLCGGACWREVQFDGGDGVAHFLEGVIGDRQAIGESVEEEGYREGDIVGLEILELVL